MILIKYALSDFKKYCPDYDNYTSFENYQNSFYKAKFLLGQNNHQIIEVEFHEQDYLQWLDKEDMQNSYLAQLCWIGNIHQGGNTKQLKNCIVCDVPFKGRADSKFCSNICRSKNYRANQNIARVKEKDKQAIKIAKVLELDFTDQDILNRINKLQRFTRLHLLEFKKEDSNYIQIRNSYRRQLGV